MVLNDSGTGILPPGVCGPGRWTLTLDQSVWISKACSQLGPLLSLKSSSSEKGDLSPTRKGIFKMSRHHNIQKTTSVCSTLTLWWFTLLLRINPTCLPTSSPIFLYQLSWLYFSMVSIYPKFILYTFRLLPCPYFGKRRKRWEFKAGERNIPKNVEGVR